MKLLLPNEIFDGLLAALREQGAGEFIHDGEMLEVAIPGPVVLRPTKAMDWVCLGEYPNYGVFVEVLYADDTRGSARLCTTSDDTKYWEAKRPDGSIYTPSTKIVAWR